VLPAETVLGEIEVIIIDPGEGVGGGDGGGCDGIADAPPPQPESTKIITIRLERIPVERSILPHFHFASLHTTPMQLTQDHLWVVR